MRLLTLLLLSCIHSISAQVNLVIEDETDQGFFLGINGYLQNPEKKKALLIKNLDTLPYVVHIDSDTFNFAKTIHLRERNTHRYVLTHDFHGDLKLRYRGTVSEPTGTINKIELDRSVPWPAELQADTTRKPGEDLLTAKNEPEKEIKPGKEVEDSTHTVKIEPPGPDPDNDVLLPGRDTLEDETRTVVVSTPGPEKQSFESFLSSLQTEDFEFERLVQSQQYAAANNLSVNEVRQIFETLRYDQTRLQFLREAGEKITDPENISKLKESLEYEISKNQFQKLIDEE